MEKYIRKNKINDVKRMILGELKSIKDYRDRVVSNFIEHVKDQEKKQDFRRVNRKYVFTYKDETGNEIVVPGVLINADKNVMRTDGVIVEALLGRADALDEIFT